MRGLPLIISGGQTGADRGSLEAAIALGAAHGGYCPKGRKAEDGVIPKKYFLKETDSTDYRERTSRNVATGDATIVFTYGEPKLGSALTIKLAQRAKKPVLHVDLTDDADANVEAVRTFVRETPNLYALNVAGSRASTAPKIEKTVKTLLIKALEPLKKPSTETPVVAATKKKKLPLFDARAAGANCDECPLNGQPVVGPTYAEGDEPDAIIVGEAPGYNEERDGRPFIGSSGVAFDRMLEKVGLNRRRLHVSNGLLCRAKQEEDFKQAIACCKPRLDRELAKFPKAPIVAMGGKALWSITGKKQRILFSRGFVWDVEGREVFPTVHPAFVARDPLWYPAYARDMRRIAKRIHDGRIDVDIPKYVVPRSLDEVERELAKVGRVIALDIETTEDAATVAKLKCVGVSDGKHTVVVPWKPEYRRTLRRFVRRRKKVIGHNIFGFDSIVMETHGMAIPIHKIEDTIVAHHAFAGHMPARLDHLVSMYRTTIPWKIAFGKRGGDEKGVAKKVDDLEELYRYNSFDEFETYWVWNDLQSDLTAAAANDLYDDDKKTAIICRTMQMNGVYVDVERKEELSLALKKKERRIARQLRIMCRGHVKKFKPTKTAQIRRMLYRTYELTPWEWTKKGLPSTNKKVLQAIATRPDTEEGKFAKLILDWRRANKMRTTYLDGLSIENDNRVHPSWRPFGTITGRLSARAPNLQNLKRFSGKSKDPEDMIRSIYTASPGNWLVGFDLSTVEAKLCGYLSGDKNLIKACEEDIHTANARLIFGNVPELATVDIAKSDGKGLRDLAKNCMYGLAYAAGAETIYEFVLAQGKKTTMLQVQTMLAKMKREYRVYYKFVDTNLAFARENGYIVEQLSGRRRVTGHYPEISVTSNFPIQAAAATIMNSMLVRICDRLPESVRVIGQVHDSAYFDTPKHLVDEVKKIIKEETAKPFTINGREVVFGIDLKDGFRWSEAA